MGMDIPSFILTEDEFHGWATRAAPGDSIVYHRGHLALDRVRTFRQEIARVADCARMLADQGQVLLVQKRIGPERCAYLAIKATSPRSRRFF